MLRSYIFWEKKHPLASATRAYGVEVVGTCAWRMFPQPLHDSLRGKAARVPLGKGEDTQHQTHP